MNADGPGPRSRELFARAQRVTPGGVHSPVRSFRDVQGQPLFIESANGATVTDADGRDYIDFCMSFGPLILGHADPDVQRASVEAINRGTSFGAAERGSLELAELLVDALDWVDAVRFVNSGTEAVMSAIRLARAFTGRNAIVKFDGCYHGHADAVLIRAGSGLAGGGAADSAGVPAGVSNDTLVARLDDERDVERIFAAHADRIAAVIIEPLPANYGLLVQRDEFLRHVASLCERHGALLIFDEVISGFRIGFGGYADQVGVRADIVTWGKIIGGGFPVGAFAARREIMDLLAPGGPVYQAGTLSANPVAMAAGLATLRRLQDGEVYAQLDELGGYLRHRFDNARHLRVQQLGSLFWITPATDAPIRSRAAIPGTLREVFRTLFRRALTAGIYLAPSPFECGFLSTVHNREHIDRLCDAALGAT